MTLRKRKDPGTREQRATGAFESSAGSECFEDTAEARNRQPLVIERGGSIRFATVAELRRLARLGLIGGAA
jgi:hypothetical protein